MSVVVDRRATPRRLLGASGLAAIAVIHLLDLAGKLRETPYLGVLYILGPIATSLLAAVLLVGFRNRLGWPLAGAISLATAVGYVLSRTTGLPNAGDDIGNWTEPLGVASLIAEGFVLLLATWSLAAGRRRTASPRSPVAAAQAARQATPVGPTEGFRSPPIRAERHRRRG